MFKRFKILWVTNCQPDEVGFEYFDQNNFSLSEKIRVANLKVGESVELDVATVRRVA
jgi:hypothetical protein